MANINERFFRYSCSHAPTRESGCGVTPEVADHEQGEGKQRHPDQSYEYNVVHGNIWLTSVPSVLHVGHSVQNVGQ